MTLIRTIAFLFSLLLFSFAHAAEKSFECTVHSFNPTGESHFGLGPKGAWNDRNKLSVSAPIQVSRVSQGAYAQTTATMPVVGPYEIVFDITWEATTINNDDVSTRPDPKIIMEARLQERLADGSTKILDIDYVEGRPGYDTPVTRRIFAQMQFKNLVAMSEYLRDPQVSNADLHKNLDGVYVEALFMFACSTEI